MYKDEQHSILVILPWAFDTLIVMSNHAIVEDPGVATTVVLGWFMISLSLPLTYNYS